MDDKEVNIRKVLETDRISALTDGIFAFSMTLLILGIAIPEIPKALAPTQLNGKLLNMLPMISDFILSFVLLATFWNIHQKQFQVIKHTDEKLNWINILLLLLIVFVPFTTELSSNYDNSVLAVSLFNINLLCISLVYYFIWRHATKAKLLDESVTPEIIKFSNVRLLIFVFVSLLALVLGQFALSWCTAVYWIIPVSFMYHRKVSKKVINKEIKE